MRVDSPDTWGELTLGPAGFTRWRVNSLGQRVHIPKGQLIPGESTRICITSDVLHSDV